MFIAICTPSRDQVSTGYAISLANLSAKLTKRNYNFEFIFCLGSVISQLRHELVTIALKKEVEWIMWIDSDMHFPNNIVERLLSHNKPIVAATYSTRYKPLRNVAFIDSDNYDLRLDKTSGIHKVWAVGMGCMLTHISVFKSIPKPWFNHQWDSKTNSFIGEDIYFCNLAQNNGFDIYVDVDLSQEIGHYGNKLFLLRETLDSQV